MTGHVAIVTGGTSGIGLQIARRLVERGDAVAIAGRRTDRVEAATRELSALGGQVAGVSTDVAEPDAVRDLVDRVARSLGPPTLGVLAAGLGHWGPVRTTTDEEWRATVRANLDGVFLTARELIPHLVASDRGQLVIISSVLAHRVAPNMAAYAAVKAGASSLGASLAAELRPHGVKVTVVSPGTTATGMRDHQVDRPKTPDIVDPDRQLDVDDVASAVLWATATSARSSPSEIVLEPRLHTSTGEPDRDDTE